jgi:hypothetical protein
MKWLFGLLVALNLVFLVWQIQFPHSVSAAGSPAPGPEVKRLLLLREVDSNQLKLIPPKNSSTHPESNTP